LTIPGRPAGDLSGIVVYGTLWCSDCKRAKQFFGDQRVHYEFVDVDADPDGMAVVEEVNGGRQIIPVTRFPDGRTLVEPSNAELASALGLQTVAERSYHDLIVVGSGPAGLTAAFWPSAGTCRRPASTRRPSRPT